MRVFIGLQMDTAFRRTLQGIQESLIASGVTGRYLAPSNLHLTLAFIGQWTGNLTGVLPEVDRPFPVRLSHLGIFPGADVLYAGLEPSEALDALAGRVRSGLNDKGIPFDRKAFVPHITLARKPRMRVPDTLADMEIPRDTMLVREVCLYQSVREAEGMVYTVIARSHVPGGGEG